MIYTLMSKDTLALIFTHNLTVLVSLVTETLIISQRPPF